MKHSRKAHNNHDRQLSSSNSMGFSSLSVLNTCLTFYGTDNAVQSNSYTSISCFLKAGCHTNKAPFTVTIWNSIIQETRSIQRWILCQHLTTNHFILKPYNHLLKHHTKPSCLQPSGTEQVQPNHWETSFKETSQLQQASISHALEMHMNALSLQENYTTTLK
jgi:hypothetical protein